MTGLLSDPSSVIDVAEIVGCLVLLTWWFSPRQRRKRLREQARERALLRRLFAEPTAAKEPTEGTGEDASVPSVSHHQPAPRPGARS